MLDSFEQALRLTSLRAGVVRAIFCPVCDGVLDCRRAVELTFTDDTDKVIAFCRVFCGTCFDTKLQDPAELAAQVADKTGHLISFEVIDGRESTKQDWANQASIAGM